MRFLTPFSSLLPFVLVLSPSATLAANVFDKASKGAVPKRDITLTLSSTKTAYASNEPVQIEVTLKNSDGSNPARILDWVVPCQTAEAIAAAKEDDLPAEMSFFDIRSQSQEKATYLGAVFKRLEPDPDSDKDYRMLMPGEEISCTIDLGDYYKFDAEGDDSEYTIEYSVENFQLSPGNSANAPGKQKHQLESLQSNTLTLKIDPRPTPSTEGRSLRGLQSGSTVFTNCGLTQQRTDLITARSYALAASREVLTVLSAVGSAQSTSSCPRYQTWFNTYNAARHNELSSGYNLIVDKLENAEVTFDCKCKQNYYAYVYPSQPYKIYLCKVFWQTGMTGTDSKMGTVIHEMSHFNVVAGTNDFTYGQSNCEDLAITNPGNAVNNADSHEYIAENTTPLSCALGPTPPPTNKPTSSPTFSGYCSNGSGRCDLAGTGEECGCSGTRRYLADAGGQGKANGQDKADKGNIAKGLGKPGSSPQTSAPTKAPTPCACVGTM